MFLAVIASLVLICVKYVNPVDVMLWKGWKSRELVWECKATQDFPTIIASTILLSYYHCPNYLTILLSLPLSFYFPTIITPHHLTILLSMLLSSLPLVKSIFHWAESHRSSQLNGSEG